MKQDIIDGFTEIESHFIFSLTKKGGRSVNGRSNIKAQFSRKFGSDRFKEVQVPLTDIINKLCDERDVRETAKKKIEEEKNPPPTIKQEIPSEAPITPPEPEEPKEDYTEFWEEIERAFLALKKEFRIVYGFCMTRPGLPPSNFIAGMTSHIDRLGESINSLFSDLGNYDAPNFKLAMVEFNNTKISIETEITDIKDKIQRMDPFDKLVDKFIRVIANYLKFVNSKIVEIAIKKGIKKG